MHMRTRTWFKYVKKALPHRLCDYGRKEETLVSKTGPIRAGGIHVCYTDKIRRWKYAHMGHWLSVFLIQKNGQAKPKWMCADTLADNCTGTHTMYRQKHGRK